jgi:hypothetical protein
MAVTQNPIIGRSKQSLSNTVFSTWKGRNVIRAKPLEVANPRTLGQVTSRNKLKVLSGMAKGLRAAVILGLKSVSQLVTEYNSFVQANYENIVSSATTGEVTAFTSPIVLSANDDPATLPVLTGVTVTSSTLTYTFSRAFTAAEVAKYTAVAFQYNSTAILGSINTSCQEVALTAATTIVVPYTLEDRDKTGVLFYNPATYKSQQSVIVTV